MNPFLCSVYRGRKDDETYLFVNRERGLKDVPEALLEKFIEPRLVTEFMLSEDRFLARANAEVVMQSIEEKGFYLQLPPSKNIEFDSIAARNDLLPR